VYNPQHDLVDYCREKGILLEAYCPLGSTNSPLLKDEELLRIAKKNGVSPATILISYQVNRGIVVLPKSVTASSKFLLGLRVTFSGSSTNARLFSGITDNLNTIKLDEEDMKTLNEMAANGKQQRVNTPLFGWDLVCSPATFSK
jgi:glycerol 2-dehydrogenase (NADP+)